MHKPVSSHTLILSAVVFTAASACGSHGSGTGSDVLLNNDPTALAGRLDLVDQEVPVNAPESLALDGTSMLTAPVLRLVGVLHPPTSGGVTLQADDVYVDGTKAYVSYNVQGGTLAGAVDVIDLTTPAKPALLSELILPTSKINGLALDNGTLYAVGETAAGGATAFLKTLAVTNGLLSAVVKTYDLPSFAGTAVAVAGNYVVAASGDQGGLSYFNKATMAAGPSPAMPDVRSVRAAPNGALVVLSGQTGALHLLDAAGKELEKVAIGGATIAQAKATVEVEANWVLSAVGDGGAVLTCAAGKQIGQIPAVKLSGAAATDTVTNAATLGGNFIYTANGEAGVYAYAATVSNSVLSDLVNGLACAAVKVGAPAVLGFDGNLSANAVFAKGGYLFVADGAGGLQIVSIVNPAG